MFKLITQGGKNNLVFVYDESGALVKVVPRCWYPFIYDKEAKSVSIRSCSGAINSEWIVKASEINGSECEPPVSTTDNFEGFVKSLSAHFVGQTT